MVRLTEALTLLRLVAPFGRMWYAEPDAISNAINYAKFYSRSHDALIRVYDEASKVIETHEHTYTLTVALPSLIIFILYDKLMTGRHEQYS